ncbi:glycosyltransferase [Rhodopseudomonas sp. HC1]|uniref:glycosyltransferase n=1 Tax=Rhodopseudomonas infernalis TaxID=2897386 RepID=UPI001EE8CBCF|nr:glycosyltransferase [Rhodopseudomonas infernalis]MCG6205224.1 glycosyltransferase [Rhodopseudomonas infernalis]
MAFLAEPAGWLIDNPLRFDRSFDDCRELERLGVRAYEDGDLRLAHFLIDRIRRIGVARAELLCLKADLSARLGFQHIAAETLDRALELDPENLHANSRLIGWSDDAAKRVHAAEQLVRLCPDNQRTLRLALRVLRDAGREIVASGQAIADEFVGWVTWDGEDSISLQVRDGSDVRRLTVCAEQAPAWAGIFDHFGQFRLPFHVDERPVHLSIESEDALLCRVSSYPTEQRRPLVRPQSAGPTNDADLTIVVPIYSDFEATRDCLDSLRPQLQASKRIVAILVDDATPDDRIKQLLQLYAADPAITVLHNDTNLGFAGAVNRALSIIPHGDVLVLNADTVLPPGAIDELARAGRCSPDIGTVTPLSNNGEYTSFPEPFRVNDLPSIEAVSDIDRAAKANRDTLVDLPNGIGFCLYITRRCLDSVGGIPQLYDRGYFEDVEFCLRARQNGFRNVCAPWIYVGHAGSRSFGGDKRSLVMRNLKKLEVRFPDYNNESTAFTKCDPLRDARGRIEKEMIKTIRFDRFLLAPDDLVGEVAMERAQNLQQSGATVLVCLLSTQHRSATFRYVQQGYRSLQFSISSAEEADRLTEYIAELKIAQFEFAGSSSLMIDVVDRLKQLRKPSDVFMADAASFDLRGCLEGSEKVTRARKSKVSRGSVSSSSRVGRYIAPNEEARAFLTSKRIGANRIVAEPNRTPAGKFRAIFSESRTIGCGVVLDERCPSAFQSFAELARRSSRVKDLQLFVLGGTLNDDYLMALGNVFVLGPTEADEIATLVDIYRLEKLMIYLPRPVFGWSKAERAWDVGLPTAYFAWPFTPVRPQGSLRMDPSQPPAVLADRLSSWFVGVNGEAVDAA